jgi:hypothetical protein
MPRYTHSEMMAICNAHVMDPDGFPLALMNASFNQAYMDEIAYHEKRIEELKGMITIAAVEGRL